MISPSYSLTATERVLPRLALDFTTAALDPRITFTRSGNTATVINSSGVIVGVNADLPRFDYNPSTLVCRGLLIEESRTNLLLNSLINGTILGTQVVVVTAAANTLSFYGTGQVVLSGAASATVVGTGAYPTRTTLTFTPSAGALTLTVTGTVQFAQLELGSFATSYIPTAASQVTRTADVATMTGTNFSNWFNASEGTFVSWSDNATTGYRTAFIADDGTSTNKMFVQTNINATGQQWASRVAGSFVVTLSNQGWNNNGKTAACYKLNDYFYSTNGAASTGDTSATVPTVNRLIFGAEGSANYLNGHVQKLMYFPQRLTNAEIRANSK
jgi:hypothetical protein